MDEQINNKGKAMSKRISLIGMIAVILYFVVVGTFLITKTDLSLTLWELTTVFSAPIILLVLLELSRIVSTPDIYRCAMIGFMSCVCSLTGTAHIVNIAVTRRLISKGIEVPLFFQIGQWPSVEMAVDYLAWGLFMGLAFICAALPVKSDKKAVQRIKVLSLICGVLCLIGFIGSIFINENLWYIAPMGYGFGFLILCILMHRIDN